MLLKFLLIIGLVLYVIYKIGSFFFKAGAATQHLRNQQRGNFNGEATSQKAKPKSTHFKGGEYVDYEEIKK